MGTLAVLMSRNPRAGLADEGAQAHLLPREKGTRTPPRPTPRLEKQQGGVVKERSTRSKIVVGAAGSASRRFRQTTANPLPGIVAVA